MKIISGLIMIAAVAVGFIYWLDSMASAEAVTHQLYAWASFLGISIGGYIVGRALENFANKD